MLFYRSRIDQHLFDTQIRKLSLIHIFLVIEINTDFINDLKVNSANLVDIVLDVEDVFDIEIDNDSMEKMLSVKAAVEIIETKLSASW